ncbi:hypothetical protein ACMBCM_09575, partial [Spiroplasma sp. K1]
NVVCVPSTSITDLTRDHHHAKPWMKWATAAAATLLLLLLLLLLYIIKRAATTAAANLPRFRLAQFICNLCVC